MTVVRGPAMVARAALEGYAVPAFNVVNLETTQAVLAAAETERAPVIAQLSPGAISYAGYVALVRLVFDLADRAAVPVLVHLDHCTDPQVVAQAIEDGFGSVMFDGSRLPIEENAEITAGLAGDAHRAGVALEAELGVIAARGDMDLATARRGRTDPAEAAQFVAATGLDVLAPALGGLHKMPMDSVPLDLDHVRAVAMAAKRPLALHGGSGIDRGQLRGAIAAGVAKVNISSNVGRALADGIRAAWSADAEQRDPRVFLGAGRVAVQSMAEAYCRLVGASGRAESSSAVGSAGVSATFVTGGSESE
jgi:fructose-bisphosphate aldolase class II